jgi:RNA-directed DNA polymerase
VVAIDTTPKVEPETQTQALRQWIKRTQEVLAYRSLQGRKFHRLYDLMRTKRLVAVALDNVLSNQGARTAGVDGVTRADLTTLQARKQLVDEIHQELRTKTYQPQPVRRVYIPKTKGKRALGIPPIRDRVVQEMLRLILEPIYEARFYAHSYGFRPFRSTHHAAVRLKDLIGRRGYTYAIEGDIRQCFDRIHHAKLLKILRQTIQDERIIRLVRAMLKAGVMEDGAWHITEEGTPQGGIVSPLLANIYLNELDWFIAAKWDTLSRRERERRHRQGVALPCYITRYADDFVILVRGTREQAEQLKAEIAAFLSGELHLELSEEKTWITPVEQGFDFLGFHIRKYRWATLITPSRQAMIKFRARVKQCIWEGFGCDDAAGIVHLNRYLIGWGMYYRRVSSARAFKQADYYVWQRVWRSTHRLRNPSLTFAQHFRAHYLPYRCDIRLRNRKRRGGHYGTWADKAHSTAYLVTKLRFIPIRYVQLHSQLNPYVPAERTVLEKRTGALETSPDPPPTSRTNPDYGIEWETLRRAVLEKAGHRCQQCGQVIRERNAHVHHRRKRQWCKSRKQANLLENLVALCPRCHRRADGQNNG